MDDRDKPDHDGPGFGGGLIAWKAPRVSASLFDRRPKRFRRHDDFRKTKPPRQRLKLFRDRVHGVRRRVRLEMHGMDEQPFRLAIGLEVEPGHKQVAEQKGKYVIAVLAFIRRRVNLDPVVEVKEP